MSVYQATSGLHAIRPGTDLPAYARALRAAHEAITCGGPRPQLTPRPVIARSWERSQQAGMQPQGSVRQDVLSVADVEDRRESSLLRDIISGLRRTVTSYAEESHFLLVVTDAQGTLLWREGSAQLRRHADSQGFVQGARWSEDRVGTNAIGTAIAEECPVQVFSAEHYCVELHPWYCAAAPVHDPRTGKLVGVVDVSGPALTLHPAIGALVETAVASAEVQIWKGHEVHLDRLRTSAAPVLSAVTGPALLVDEDGWVAQAVGFSAARRVAVPREARAVSVPGLGMCLPERIAEGWILRPSGRAQRMLLALDLSGSPAVSTIGSDHPWRVPLTSRHAEILLLVHLAGAEGIAAAALSEALFGDAEHGIAVRAEVSRLRRVLGGILLSRPYRIAGDVELVVALGEVEVLADCALVRASTSPGVRALANR
ncbi:MAG: GAF domain-containing protein [Sporichthyaceae bacterium]